MSAVYFNLGGDEKGCALPRHVNDVRSRGTQGIALTQRDADDPGCSLIPGLGSSSSEHPCRVQGSLRDRGVPSA